MRSKIARIALAGKMEKCVNWDYEWDFFAVLVNVGRLHEQNVNFTKILAGLGEGRKT